MTDLASFVIVGAIVSILVQALKNWLGTSPWKTLFIVVILSLLAGVVYQFLYQTQYWETFVSILVTAGAVYTYIIQRFETKPSQ